MGLLGHSPSRLPPDADTHMRDELHEHIGYPQVHKGSVKHAQDPSYNQQHAASPFGREPARGQYQEDTAPLVSAGAPRTNFVKVSTLTDGSSVSYTVLQGYWMGLEAWRKTKGIASIDLRRPMCVTHG